MAETQLPPVFTRRTSYNADFAKPPPPFLDLIVNKKNQNQSQYQQHQYTKTGGWKSGYPSMFPPQSTLATILVDPNGKKNLLQQRRSTSLSFNSQTESILSLVTVGHDQNKLTDSQQVSSTTLFSTEEREEVFDLMIMRLLNGELTLPSPQAEFYIPNKTDSGLLSRIYDYKPPSNVTLFQKPKEIQYQVLGCLSKTEFGFIVSAIRSLKKSQKNVFIKLIATNTEEFRSLIRYVNPNHHPLVQIVKNQTKGMPFYLEHFWEQDFLCLVFKTHGKKQKKWLKQGDGYEPIDQLFFYQTF